MSYPDATINSAFINEYRANVIHLAQQGESRLRPNVTEVSSSGENYYFEFFNQISTDGDTTTNPDYDVALGVFEKTGRRAETQYYDDEWTNRGTKNRTFNTTLTFENEDKLQMLVDPQSTYVQGNAMAMRRAYDRLIIEAATADTTNKAGDTIVLPAGRTIGDGTAPISFDMVTEVQELFLQSEVMMDIGKVAVIGPTQVRKLLQLTEQTSSDYVNREALQNLTQFGVVPNWMGFRWIVSNFLEAPAGGELNLLFFSPKAIGLVVNQDIRVKISEEGTMSYMWQVFTEFNASATRLEDEHIVIAHVADTL